MSLEKKNISNTRHEETKREHNTCDSIETSSYKKYHWFSFLTICFTGLGYLLYNQIISRHLHDEKRYWFSKWIPTTWTYFVNKLQNEEISSITLMEQFIFYQDNKGELFSTGLLPGSSQWLFENIKRVPDIVCVPKQNIYNFTTIPILTKTNIKYPFPIGFPTNHYLAPKKKDSVFKIDALTLTFLILSGISFLYDSKWLVTIFSKTPKNEKKTVDTQLTLENFIGHEDVKQELLQLTQLMKNPSIIQSLGARFPRGVMIEGPTGTGKTSLVRALVHEAGVSNIYVSASSFVELYVGQGALRIRELFKKAKCLAPCLIHIDELDALGANRDTLASNSHEYIQTINQLLTELDELESFNQQQKKYVLVVATTNRFGFLDPALTRAGRFDKLISLKLPTKNQRRDICLLFCRNKTIDLATIRIDTLAELTEGWAGADLETLFNEAALLAARQGSTQIKKRHLTEIFNQIQIKKQMVQKQTPSNRFISELQSLAELARRK